MDLVFYLKVETHTIFITINASASTRAAMSAWPRWSRTRTRPWARTSDADDAWNAGSPGQRGVSSGVFSKLAKKME